tara:strand:- start:30791 stop:31672 length:882 start_codon:yes stop_codon:yes gene_type:complete
MYFINDGKYADPYEISGVSVFAAANNMSPNSIITPEGEIDSSVTSLVKMHFANIKNDGDSNTDSSSFDTSNYTQGAGNASGVYRLAEGQYAVILDQNVLSATFNLSGASSILNTVSGVGDYLDVWTVKHVNGSNLTTIINDFTLTEDKFFGVTEPLLFRVNTQLENNHVVLGSKVDLKFTNDFTLENTNIDRSIVNLFKDSLVVNPQIEIYKKNDDRNLASRVMVSSYAETSGLSDLTSANTVIFNLDTEALKTHPSMLDGTLGSQTGVYIAKLRFQALNQTIVSNDLAFIIR